MILRWLDDRTGYQQLIHEALYENIPGGASWRYVTGSMLVFAFATQAITGIFLWACYSPGSQNAWESVYFIQYEMQGGWLLRGIHHFMAQAMVVLLPIHMLQVIWDKAYRAPREINYWLGLILMQITLGLSLTGYLLPWDQKGFWATKVATNLMSLVPVAGPYIQKIVVGGSDYGHHTLTRFFALHAGLLPAALIGFLALHVAMFRKHGITADSSPNREDQFFWPFQVLKDGVACLLLLVVVLLAVVHFDVVGVVTLDVPVEHRGAHMGAPADAVEEYKAARPEWYFLFLFQLLKNFEDEFVGAIVIPGAIMGFLFLMPFIGRWKAGHVFNVVAFLGLFVGAGYLTAEALYDDNYEHPWLGNKFDETKFSDDKEAKEAYERPFKAAREFHEAVANGHHEFARIRELIEFYGIPRGGAVVLQRNDPETMGPRIFRRSCNSCHSYTDRDGNGIAGPTLKEGETIGAPNLYNFADIGWIGGLLDAEQIAGPNYFGRTGHAEGDMVGFVTDFDADDATKQNIALALSAEAGLLRGQSSQAAEIEAGRQAIADNCTECHQFRGQGDPDSVYAPDLTGYGSPTWLRLFIANPDHETLYNGENDRMPAFATSDDPTDNLLTDHDIDMLVRWIRGDDRDLELKLRLRQAALDEATAQSNAGGQGDKTEPTETGDPIEGDAKEGDAKEGDGKEGDAAPGAP